MLFAKEKYTAASTAFTHASWHAYIIRNRFLVVLDSNSELGPMPDQPRTISCSSSGWEANDSFEIGSMPSRRGRILDLEVYMQHNVHRSRSRSLSLSTRGSHSLPRDWVATVNGLPNDRRLPVHYSEPREFHPQSLSCSQQLRKCNLVNWRYWRASHVELKESAEKFDGFRRKEQQVASSSLCSSQQFASGM